MFSLNTFKTQGCGIRQSNQYKIQQKSYLLLKSLNALSGKVNEGIIMLLLMKIKGGLKWHSENKPNN